jgi:hypothetical protein
MICGSGSRQLFQEYGYWIRECEACGHQFTEIEQRQGHVDSIYGDHYFGGDPTGYPDHLAEPEPLVAHGRSYARLMNQYMKPGRLLDVGAAAGFVMKGFVGMGWCVVGIKPNPGMADHTRDCLGLDVETCTLEDFQATDRFDLPSMIQVVPHFVDPTKAGATLCGSDDQARRVLPDRNLGSAKLHGPVHGKCMARVQPP